MRYVLSAIALACAVLFICLALAVAISQPRAHAQLHNPYWPFSVETVITDK